MQTAPWLDKLHDIALPMPVAGWPPAPGWWLVMALAALLMVRAAIALWHWHRRQAGRRAALAACRRLASADAAPAHAIGECLRHLRTCAVAAGPLAEVNAARGTAWLALLAQLAPRAPVPDATLGALLCEGAYRPPRQLQRADAERVLDYTRRWLRAFRP